MATLSGRVIFDRDRSATIFTGDAGLANIPVVLQNTDTTERLTVLTDANGSYTFLNVPNGSYRIVESYGTPGGVPTPGDFSTAAAGSVPAGSNPPITAATNPPPGSTNLDSLTPDTLLVTVSGADLTGQNFLNGPVINTPIQAILDPCVVIAGNNLINAAEAGTFGAFSPGTPTNTGAPGEPYPGVTPDFTYVLPNPTVFAPLGGEYTVQNIMTNSMSAEIGAWWRIADHTTGNETGRFLVVNGFQPGAVFFRDTVTVQPNTNYLFTSWILNLFRINGYPDPKLGVRILDETGGVLYSATLGALIPVNGNAPQWRQIGSVVNSQTNTSLTVEFLSEGPEAIGNDYAIDDISFHEILVPQFLPVKAVDRQTANVGETVAYTVTLTNPCQSPLTDVFFQDVLPSGLSFVPGSVVVNGTTDPEMDPNTGFVLPDVPGGAAVTVEFAALVTEVPTPNPARNSANITLWYTPVEGGIPGIFNVTSNEAPVEVGTLADLSVVKTASPSPITPGDQLTYSLTVANAGPSASENAVLTDDIPASLTNVEYSIDGGSTFAPWTGSLALGAVAAGENRSILIRGTLSPSASDEIVSTAAVTSDTLDPNPDNNTSTVVTPVSPAEASADLSVVKTSAPNPVQAGGALTYTLSIFNAGPDAVQRVLLTDSIPAGLLNPEFSLDGGVTWQPWTGSSSLKTLAAGGSIVVLIRAAVSSTASGSIVNTAVVTSDTRDPNPTNNTGTNTTNLSAGADVSVTKSAQPAAAVLGEPLTYTVTIRNNGPDRAESVMLYDHVPPELSHAQFSMDGGATWNVWSNPDSLGQLAAGESRTILIRGTVTSSACGIISNTAVAASTTPDPNAANNTDTSNTPVQAEKGADLSIQKTVYPNPAIRCQYLTYTLTVKNQGPETAEQVVVSDLLPAELCKPIFSADGGRTWHNWEGRYRAGNLTAGSSVSILVAAIVSPCAAGCIQNTAAVSSLTPDPNSSNNLSCVTANVWSCLSSSK